MNRTLVARNRPAHRRSQTLLLATVLAVGLLGGCKSDQERLVEHLEAIASIVQRNDGDCATMATELDAYLDEHEAVLEEVVESLAADDDRGSRDDLKRRFAKAAEGIQASRTCAGSHAPMAKALIRFNGVIQQAVD